MDLQVLREQYDNPFINESENIRQFDFNCTVEANVNIQIEAESYEQALEMLYNKEFRNFDVDLNEVDEVNEMNFYTE